MLFDQIAKERPEGVTLFLFRQGAGDIARNRIRSSGADLPVDSRKLMLRQADGDLRLGHTSIIPLLLSLETPAAQTNTPPGTR